MHGGIQRAALSTYVCPRGTGQHLPFSAPSLFPSSRTFADLAALRADRSVTAIPTKGGIQSLAAGVPGLAEKTGAASRSLASSPVM